MLLVTINFKEVDSSRYLFSRLIELTGLVKGDDKLWIRWSRLRKSLLS
jgi:hypothetical protein